MERHRAPDPVGRADHVARVDLREVVHAGRAGTARLIVSPLSAASVRSTGWASSTRSVSSTPRCAKRSSAGPGRIAPRAESRCTSAFRSSAATTREAVLLGRSVRRASSPSVVGLILVQHEHEQLRGALDGLGTARASCLALTQHVGLMFPIVESSADLPVPSITHQTGGRMFVNKLPRYEILSPDAVETLERGWKRIVSELGVEFLLPEAVELFAKAGHADGGRLRLAGPGLHPRAGGQGAAQLRRAGAQSGQQRAHRRRPHGVLVGLRPAVRAPGRRAPRRDDGRLPQLREARALVPRARHDRRHDRRAERHAARLAPPRHGARAADALGQGLHGLGDVRPERGRHDAHDRDPARAAARRSRRRPA